MLSDPDFPALFLCFELALFIYLKPFFGLFIIPSYPINLKTSMGQLYVVCRTRTISLYGTVEMSTSDLGCFLYDLDITDEIVTSQPLLSCSVRAA